jgi:hypothetical protein
MLDKLAAAFTELVKFEGAADLKVLISILFFKSYILKVASAKKIPLSTLSADKNYMTLLALFLVN